MFVPESVGIWKYFYLKVIVSWSVYTLYLKVFLDGNVFTWKCLYLKVFEAAIYFLHNSVCTSKCLFLKVSFTWKCLFLKGSIPESVCTWKYSSSSTSVPSSSRTRYTSSQGGRLNLSLAGGNPYYSRCNLLAMTLTNHESHLTHYYHIYKISLFSEC